jgi:hypothetical protein
VRKAMRIVMLSIVSLMAAVGIGATAPANAAAPYSTVSCDGCKYNYISANAVRIRKTPGGAIMGLTWYNQRVQLIGKQQGQWAYVSTRGPKGKALTGWVSSNYIGTQY